MPGAGGHHLSLRAVVGVKRGKSAYLAVLQETMILKMGCLHGEVAIGNEQHEQFDPGGRWGDAPHAK